MSSPDDEVPPKIHQQPTLPDLEPENDTHDPQPHGLAIPSGFARFAFWKAVIDLRAALDVLVATGDALARALDEEARKP